MEESDYKKPFRREERTGNYAHSIELLEFPENENKGYYVDVTDLVVMLSRAFRKLKRMYKETKFFEQMRERESYTPPSARRREKEKERRKVLRRLQRERDDNRLMGHRRKK
jgi:ribosomal protein S21